MWAAIITRTVQTARKSQVSGGTSKPASRSLRLASMAAVGLIGAWMQLSIHQVVDNLFVANMFLLVGVYIGLLDGLGHERSVDSSQPTVPVV
jgi:hypothetical protein